MSSITCIELKLPALVVMLSRTGRHVEEYEGSSPLLFEHQIIHFDFLSFAVFGVYVLAPSHVCFHAGYTVGGILRVIRTPEKKAPGFAELMVYAGEHNSPTLFLTDQGSYAGSLCN